MGSNGRVKGGSEGKCTFGNDMSTREKEGGGRGNR